MLALWMLLLLLLCMSMVIISLPLVILVTKNLGILDIPDADGVSRKIHQNPIPRTGGLAIILVVPCLMMTHVLPQNIQFIYFCSIPIFLLGFLDDCQSLSAKFRLILQTLVAGLCISYGELSIKSLNLTQTYSLPLNDGLGFFLSLFIVVGSINCVNLIDGLDGLASGLTCFSFLALTYLNVIQTDSFSLAYYVSIPLIGAVLGFLRFNTHPAKIFLGDGGSTWLGFMVGIVMLLCLKSYHVPLPDFIAKTTLSDKATNAGMSAIPFASILLCLIIPITDTATVIWTRIKSKKSPFSPDKNHLHHHLLRIGLTQRESVALLYFLALFFSAIGIAPIAYQRPNLWYFTWGALAIIPVALGLLRLIDSDRVNGLLQNKEKTLEVKKDYPEWQNYWFKINKYLLCALITVPALFAGQASEQIGYAAIIGVTLVFITLIVPRVDDTLHHLSLAFAILILLIAINYNPLIVEISGNVYKLQVVYNSLYYGLFFSSIGYFIATLAKESLEVNPTDFLLLMIPFILLLAPPSWNAEYRLTTISLRSVCLFFCLRVLTRGKYHFSMQLKKVLIGALFLVLMTSLFEMKIIYTTP